MVQSNPRVLVAGAGALGSVFGGFLRKAGFPVAMLGRDAHLRAIDDHGLAIDGIWGDHQIHGLETATRADNLAGSFDAILITVKSYDTAEVTRSVIDRLRPDGTIISLQNGLGNVETIEAIAGAERTIGARVIFGAEITAPGRAHVSVIADPNAVGALTPDAFPARDAAARAWAERFNAADLPSTYTTSLAAKLWGKVLYNAALNPLGALLGVHYGALPEQPESKAIMDQVIEEAFAVATADRALLPFESAEAYRREFYARLVPATYNHRPSMLQDLEAGRPTEIAAINGEVVRRGRQHGIATPVNETLERLIRLRARPAQ